MQNVLFLKTSKPLSFQKKCLHKPQTKLYACSILQRTYKTHKHTILGSLSFCHDVFYARDLNCMHVISKWLVATLRCRNGKQISTANLDCILFHSMNTDLLKNFFSLEYNCNDSFLAICGYVRCKNRLSKLAVKKHNELFFLKKNTQKQKVKLFFLL